MTLDSQDMGVTIAPPEERRMNLEHLLDLEIIPGSSVSGIMGGSMEQLHDGRCYGQLGIHIGGAILRQLRREPSAGER